MGAKHGNLSINSDNIFPIIKKWMYSDKDIFVREMISNCSDAITKRKKLSLAGECTLPDDYQPKIEVITDDKERTLTFIDNGLGMTGDEVEEYIAQIAFSGATEFIEKYKDKADADQIIGHFGLGFYSAFMVAKEVKIDTLSYKEGAKAVTWTCDGGTEYDMEDGDRAEVGTTITLYLNDDSLEFSNEYQVRETVSKYCAFMPYEIFVTKQGAEPVMTKDADGNEVPEEPKPVNDIHPLWNKHPNECTDEEYKAFYRKVFHDYKEPLFWIHLNMDYPFNLKGILYFPRINTEYEAVEGTIKLYNNQVFIADNIKEVIPEYLMLLKGVIDCPDLPLNVSRSALQNDGFVTKISDYISKKVADKLSGMCKVSREDYEKYWDDIHPFIKYGCLKDVKFADKMMDYILYKDLDGKYLTLDDIVPKEEQVKKEKEEEKKEGEAEVVDENGEKVEEEEQKPHTIYYVTDTQLQSQYINMFKEEGRLAVVLSHAIDVSFIQYVEEKKNNIRFMRIDSQIDDELTDDEEISAEDAAELESIFRKATGNNELTVKTENLKNEKLASVIVYSEDERRMMEMMKAYGMTGAEMGGFEPKPSLVLNKKHPLVSYILEHKRSKNGQLVAEQLFDLAMLMNRPLSPEEMTKFVERSNAIMLKILK